MVSHEVRDIIISALALALAFAIALNGGFSRIFSAQILEYFILSLFTVSVAFILHELAHRFVARKYKHYAEFKRWNTGLGMALLFSLFGFVFAAPGAVVIHQKSDMWGRIIPLSPRKYGIISLAGPATNVILAAVFYIIGVIMPSGIISTISSFGITVNIWLAVFNMLPIPPLDGSKIIRWDAKIWLASFIVMLALLIFLA